VASICPYFGYNRPRIEDTLSTVDDKISTEKWVKGLTGWGDCVILLVERIMTNNKLPTMKQIRGWVKGQDAQCSTSWAVLYHNDMYSLVWTSRVVDTSVEVPCTTFPLEAELFKRFCAALMDAGNYEWRADDAS
jgi:hypothetical protein